MPKSGQTPAQKMREDRRETLREQLSNQKHLEHAVDMIKELADLDNELEPISVTRLDKAIGHKLSIVRKYLPDIKAVEITGDNGTDLFRSILSDIANEDDGLPSPRED